MDYCEFMNRAMDYVGSKFDYEACSECGGTGLESEKCCNGKDCGCMGLPIDFKDCTYCGKRAPSERDLKAATTYERT